MKIVYEKHKRSALKTLSWRAIASATTMSLIYAFTGRLELAAGIGIVEVILKMLFYFLHERTWNRIAFGKGLIGKAESAMRTPVITVLPSENISSVIQKMVMSDIGAVIVANQDELNGLITERDILERVLQIGKKPFKTFAGNIMSSPVATVDHITPLDDVLKKMRKKQIRRLAVTQNDKLVGIVTERRILKTLIK